MNHRTWLGPAVAAVALGCGRVGYDPRDAAAPARADAPRPAAADAPAPPDAPLSQPAAPIDHCRELPRLARPPVIDGVLDPDLRLQTVTPVGWNGGDAGLPPDQRAELAAAWRPDGVYFYVHVVDGTRVPYAMGTEPWCGDSAELYLDDDGRVASPPMYDDPGTRQYIVIAPPDATTRVAEGWGYRDAKTTGPWTAPGRFGAWPVADGYVVEAFVTAADLGLADWPLAPGATIGMDVGVNVSPDSAPASMCFRRIGQYFLHIRSTMAPEYRDFPYGNPEAFCTPRLLP